MKLTDLLTNSANKYPDRAAVKDPSCELSYSQLLQASRRIGKCLSDMGYGPGRQIALVLPNAAGYFSGFFGVLFAGAAVVPMYARMTSYEIERLAVRADISAILTDSAGALKLHKANSPAINVSLFVLNRHHDEFSIEILAKRPPKKADSETSDISLMVYTSGSTGQAKIVMLTDKQLISNMLAYARVMRFDSANTVYCSLALHHIYCICAQLLTHIYMGDTFITTENPFFINDFFKAVDMHEVTITAFVPYMAILMSQYPEPDRFDLSSLRHITLSAAKTPQAVYRKLSQRFSHIKFINTYGMSEAGSRISIAAPNPHDFPATSVGKPLPGVQVRITDQSRKTLLPYQAGEVEIKSNGTFQGYYKQPALTAETISDGWLRTGDLGKLDQDGNLYLIGRKKDIIISGGENILPGEIEELLLEHELIAEAAVVGLADDRLQEAPYAFITTNNGQPDESGIRRFCLKRLSSFKVPRRFFFIDSIPMLNNTKVNRQQLIQLALRLLGQQP